MTTTLFFNLDVRLLPKLNLERRTWHSEKLFYCLIIKCLIKISKVVEEDFFCYFLHHILPYNLHHTFSTFKHDFTKSYEQFGLVLNNQKTNRDPVRRWVGQQPVCQAQDSNMTKTRCLCHPRWHPRVFSLSAKAAAAGRQTGSRLLSCPRRSGPDRWACKPRYGIWGTAEAGYI